MRYKRINCHVCSTYFTKLHTFDPTAFETAMSPYPSLITAIELNASGIDTPAATNVKPIELGFYA